VFTIIGDNSEEFDDNNKLVINPVNVTRGVNHMAEGDTMDSLATRAKVRLTVDEWKTIKAAVNEGATIPIDMRKEVLLVTRVNSANVLDEGLRIGGRGRRMNSKLKIIQTRQGLTCIENKRGTQLAQSQSVPGRPLLAPLYRWSGLKDLIGFNTNCNVCIQCHLVFRLYLCLGLPNGPRGTKIMGLISYTLVSSPRNSTGIVDSGKISNLYIFDLINLRLLLFPYIHQTIYIIYFSRGFLVNNLRQL
jgi:hypothetical protein